MPTPKDMPKKAAEPKKKPYVPPAHLTTKALKDNEALKQLRESMGKK